MSSLQWTVYYAVCAVVVFIIGVIIIQMNRTDEND